MEYLVGIDAHEHKDGTGEILRPHRLVIGFGGGRVGGPLDMPALDSPARHRDAEDPGPVVASAIGIEFRGAAKLRRHQHQRAIEQSPPVEIANQCRIRLIEGGHL